MSWFDIIKETPEQLLETLRDGKKPTPAMIDLPETDDMKRTRAQQTSDETSRKVVDAAIAAKNKKNQPKPNIPLPKEPSKWRNQLRGVGSKAANLGAGAARKVGSSVKNQLTTRQRDHNPNAPSRLKPKQPDPNSRLQPKKRWEKVLGGNQGPKGPDAPIKRKVRTVKRNADNTPVIN
tara:strand:+ start:1463 stop:1996 length:534 start_codon:yes stop_codon:yes gene_type:complete